MSEISAYHEADHSSMPVYGRERSCPVSRGSPTPKKDTAVKVDIVIKPLRLAHSTVECDAADDASGLASASCGQLSADQRRDPLDGLVRQAGPTGSEEVRIGGRCINCTGFCTAYVRNVRISQGFIQ